MIPPFNNLQGVRGNGLEQGALNLGITVKVSIKYKYTFDQGFKSPILTLHKTLATMFHERHLSM
jgi:hypothetical protein